MHHPTRSGPPRRGSGPRAWLRAAMVAAAALAAAAPPAAAQQGELSGVVVEAQSQRPVAGAQVTVQGQTRSAVTDPEGRFRITGVQGTSVTVQVDRLGYSRVTRQVTVGQAGIRIPLAEAALSLDAVVVTGTPGGAEKRTLGNAVTRLDVAETVREGPVNNMADLLNARVPGVVIIPATGNVGGGSRIRVRGVSSLSLPQEPLVYVDGVRVINDAATGPINQGFGSNSISRFNDINPEDIESIEVIRGPAAATLYGTEASNGVIQIITKRGSAGGTRWDMSVRQGALWFANADERVWTNWGVDTFTGDTTSIDVMALEKAAGRDVWQTGRVQSYNLSLNGGTPTVRYYLSGGMDRDEGVEANNQLKRWNARVNVTAEPRSDMDVRASAGYVSSFTSLPLEAGGGGTAWTTFFANPANLTLADGTPNPRRGFHSATPEGYRYAYEDWQDVNRFTGGMELNHRPTDWLAHRLALGADVTREQNVELVERMDDPAFTGFFTPGEIRGYRDQNNRIISYTSLDYSAAASFSPRANLSSQTTVGAQAYRRFLDIESANGSDFPVRGLRAVNAAAVRSGGSNYIEDITVGAYVQQQFGLNDRVFVTVGLRADDNSNFGEDFDLVYYPKISGSWVVSDEPFFSLPWVSGLKLRAAYGESGQQPLFATSIPSYRVVPGPGGISTITPDNVGNPELGPERGSEVELGFDAGFMDERLGVEFTYYNKLTDDAILQREIAPSLGFPGRQYFNAGQIRNSGVELLVRGTAIRRENVELELTFNLATNHNEVLDLGIAGLDTVQAGTYVRHVEGHPVGSWWEKRVVDAQFNPTTGRLIAGSEMCDDGNGGTVACAVAPQLFLGRPTPSREGAFTPALTLWGRLRLAGMLDFKQGYHKLDGNLRVRCVLFLRCRENWYPTEFLDDPAWLAQTQRGGTYVNGLISDASFTRLRELSATYTLPGDWASRFGASRASISVAGRNLYTWTDYTGIEPEASFLGGSRGGGSAQWEQNVTPQLAQFVTTINLSF